jgi:hypothetical protein
MTKFKDFGSPTISEEREDVTFSLHGQSFACRSAIPGKIMLDLAAMSSDDENPGAAAKAIDVFFKAVLATEDDYARFDGLCKDPDVAIEVETLFEIVQWLMETYGERPTQRSED